MRGFSDFEVCATPPCLVVSGLETAGACAVGVGFSFVGACAVGAGCFSFMGACAVGAGLSFVGACAVGVGDFCDTLPGWWSIFPPGVFWSCAAVPGAPWFSLRRNTVAGVMSSSVATCYDFWRPQRRAYGATMPNGMPTLHTPLAGMIQACARSSLTRGGFRCAASLIRRAARWRGL